MKVKLPNTEEVFDFLVNNVRDYRTIRYETSEYLEVFFENDEEAKYAVQSFPRI